MITILDDDVLNQIGQPRRSIHILAHIGDSVVLTRDHKNGHLARRNVSLSDNGRWLLTVNFHIFLFVSLIPALELVCSNILAIVSDLPDTRPVREMALENSGVVWISELLQTKLRKHAVCQTWNDRTDSGLNIWPVVSEQLNEAKLRHYTLSMIWDLWAGFEQLAL